MENQSFYLLQHISRSSSTVIFLNLIRCLIVVTIPVLMKAQWAQFDQIVDQLINHLA